MLSPLISFLRLKLWLLESQRKSFLCQQNSAFANQLTLAFEVFPESGQNNNNYNDSYSFCECLLCTCHCSRVLLALINHQSNVTQYTLL